MALDLDNAVKIAEQVAATRYATSEHLLIALSEDKGDARARSSTAPA